MKTISFLFLLLILSIQISAQVTQEWAKRYNSPGNLSDFTNGVAVDAAGNIYVSGFSGLDPVYDYTLIKYNPDGDVIWVRNYDFNNLDSRSYAMILDNEGNIYITGESKSTNIFPVDRDIATIKYDPSGAQLWVQRYNGSINEVANKLGVDDNNNIYVGGQSGDNGIIIKYNSFGEQQWAQPITGSLREMTVDNNGNIYIAGAEIVNNIVVAKASKYNTNGSLQWSKNPLGTSVGSWAGGLKVDNDGNVFVVMDQAGNYVTAKYNSNGVELWAQSYQSLTGSFVFAYNIAIDDNGNCYLSGTDYTNTSNNEDDITTIKYSPLGNQLWARTYNGPDNRDDEFRTIQTDNEGNVYINVTTYGVNNTGIALIKYSSDGETLWMQTYNTPNNEYASRFAIDNNYNIYATGSTYDQTNLSDIILIKYTQDLPLKITNPVSGIKWMAGEKDTIKWTGGKAGQLIQLESSLDDGQTYDVIDFGIDAELGKFTWSKPKNLVSTKMRIKIFDMLDPLNNSVSDAFRIKPYVLTRIDQNGDYVDYWNQRDIWGFENIPDHMWPQEWYQQFDYSGIDPFTGTQYSQWQALSAFKNAPASFFADWISFVNAFSVDACYNSTSLGFYDWAAVILWKSYHSKWEGSCFGIATANALAFYKRDQFIAKYPDFPQITDPINLQANDAVRKVISELFTHQLGNPSDAIDLASKNKTPNETLEEIRQMVQVDNSIVRTLSIGNNSGKGAHSIIAYGLEQDESNTNIYKIKVYDNNDRNSEIDIIVNTQDNNNNGTWSYAEQPNWGGSKRLYLDVPAELHLSGTTFPRGQNTQSPFIIPENVVNINYPTESPIVIKDNQGNITGLVNDVIYEDIPNSFARRIKNGSEVAPLGYSLGADNYSVTLSGFEESTVGTYFFTGNKSLVYGRTGAEQTQTDRLFFDGGLSAVNPDVQNKEVSLSTLINETVNQKLLSVSSLDLAQNDSVKIVNPDSNTVKLISYGSTKNYEIEVNYLSDNGIGRFGNISVQLDANTSHTFVPVWTDLTNSELQVLIDIGNDGTIDDTLSLVNQVTGIGEDQGSLLTPNSYNLAQNYPNPFNPSTKISWQSPVGSYQTLKIYDVLGNEVTTLVDEFREAGRYEITFDASNLSSGIYFYKLQAGSFVEIKKMIVIK